MKRLIVLSLVVLVSFISIRTFADTTESIMVGSTTRSMLVHIPDGLRHNRPLLISMHGMNQDPAYQQNQTKWENVADTAEFAVVYPKGINNAWDISGTSDINFVLAVIDTMYNRYQIDKNRVYLSGFSMGSMFTYHAANNIADKIAAFAPVCGISFSNTFNSSRPIPIISICGMADEVFDYSSIEPYILGWVKRNNCPTTAVETCPYPAGKSTTTSKKYWGPGDNNVEVVLISLEGKGHWHSNDGNGVMSSREIWEFVSRYSLVPGQPWISIKTPVTGSKYLLSDSIEIIAQAKDDTKIKYVRFYADNILLNADSVAPFRCVYRPSQAGKKVIKAFVHDEDNHSCLSKVTIYIETPSGPALTSTIPLDESFDLPLDTKDFILSFDSLVDFSKAQAVLYQSSDSIVLLSTDSADAASLHFCLPNSISLNQGNYTLQAYNIYSTHGFPAKDKISIGFRAGVSDYQADTILADNLDTGGCVPAGWKIAWNGNTREQLTDGYTLGPRLMDFPNGGDFKAAFYLRDEGGTSCLSYGSYANARLKLPKGLNVLSFYYAWWTEGAKNNQYTVSFKVEDISGNQLLGNVVSTDCLISTNSAIPTGATRHEFEMEQEAEKTCILKWETDGFGWDGCLIGGVNLICYDTKAAIYKNELAAALSTATRTLKQAEPAIYDGAIKMALAEIIDRYSRTTLTHANAIKTAVGDIESATEKMLTYMRQVISELTPVTEKGQPTEIIYYAVTGQRLKEPHPGINLVKEIYQDGHVAVKKIILEN